jgi:hypothetical protein
MAANKTPIATDSAEELRGLIGDDASATFESDPNFVNSNPTESASSDNIALRDTDDTEDSEEEDDEEDEDEDVEEDDLDEEDDDEVDEDEDDDEEGDEDEDDLDEDDDDEEDEDDEDEVLRTAEPVDVHGSLKHSKEDIERELEEMEDETGEDEDVEIPEDDDEGEAGVHAERAVDAALRMKVTQATALGY